MTRDASLMDEKTLRIYLDSLVARGVLIKPKLKEEHAFSKAFLKKLLDIWYDPKFQKDTREDPLEGMLIKAIVIALTSFYPEGLAFDELIDLTVIVWKAIKAHEGIAELIEKDYATRTPS